MEYTILKAIHVIAVIVSFSGFVARGIAAWRGARWARLRITRRLADLVDTVLLLSAFGMLSILHLWPWAAPWLRAKIVGLLVYIALGILALRPVRSPNPAARGASPRLGPWIGAIVVFGYIVAVALTKSPELLSK